MPVVFREHGARFFFWRVLKCDAKRLKGLGMSISVKAVRCDEETLWVDLVDGRTMVHPWRGSRV